MQLVVKRSTPHVLEKRLLVGQFERNARLRVEAFNRANRLDGVDVRLVGQAARVAIEAA